MNKKEVKSFEEVEKYFEKTRKIKFSDEIVIKDLEDLFVNLFGERPGCYSSSCSQKNTYYKKGIIQCDTEDSKYRSFNDFFILVKQYFPEITIKETIDFISKKEKDLNQEGLSFIIAYCGNIRKSNIRGISPYGQKSSFKEYNLQDLFPKLDLQIKNI